VSEGVREQVTSTAGSLEWDVVLTAPPADSGPLTVNANLDGVVGTPARVDANTAWKLSLVGGAHVTLGETIVKDATGAELYRALPIVTAGTIKLVVPDSVLTNAAYPVTIDPKVGPRVPVGETYTASDDPAVAFDGTNYLIVWSGYDLEGEDFNIHGARVSGDGSFVQELGQISPTNAGHDSTLPDVAWNGSSYLVVWQYDYSDTDIDIHGQRVAANGALLGGTFTVSNPLGNQRDPAVTAGGATFYVAWGDNRAAATTDIYGGRVSTAGVRLDGNGILVAHETKNDDWPDIAWNGSNFLVVFTFQSSSDSDVHARVVNASAVPVGAVHIIQAGPSRAERAAVASNGTDFFVVWNDFRNSATTSIDIYGARVAGTGTIITGNIAISRASDLQSEPAIAFNGTYLVAWEDRRNSTLDIYADRINANGAVQDGSGFVVETGSTAQLTAPALAAGPGTKWAIDYSWLHPELGASIIHRNIAPK
jgi:hypothetical protein